MRSHCQGIKKRDQFEKHFRARGMPLPPKWDMWPRQSPSTRYPFNCCSYSATAP